jgi:hypothetical protein
VSKNFLHNFIFVQNTMRVSFDVDVFTTEHTELTEKNKIFLPRIYIDLHGLNLGQEKTRRIFFVG